MALRFSPHRVEDRSGAFNTASASALVGYTAAGGLDLAPRRRPAALLSVLVVQSCLRAGLGSVHRPWLALVMMIGTGALNGFFNISLTTAFQIGSDESLRGRTDAGLRALPI